MLSSLNKKINIAINSNENITLSDSELSLLLGSLFGLFIDNQCSDNKTCIANLTRNLYRPNKSYLGLIAQLNKIFLTQVDKINDTVKYRYIYSLLLEKTCDNSSVKINRNFLILGFISYIDIDFNNSIS